MNSGGRKFGSAPILLAQVSRVVVSQTVIQRELSCHLPGILSINAELFFSGSGTSRVGHVNAIDQAQKETGVTKTHIGAVHSGSLERLACLCSRECVDPIRIAINDRRIPLGSELGAELVRMAVPNPIQVSVKRWALRNLIRCRLRPDGLHTTRPIPRQQTRHCGKELVLDT